MRVLSFQIIFIFFTLNIFAQSPHGDNFDIDCSNCHIAESWKINLSKVTFDHSKTNFNLIGQHQAVDCRSCHQSLKFSKMEKDCISCHKDIHQGTVGFDCTSCHNSTSWIVKDIIGLHQTSRFPLLGAHKLLDCAQCHIDYPELKFEPLNLDCYACHAQNYISAQSPNHTASKFSTDCQECHSVNAFSWSTTNINHSFFPLAGAHALPNCFSCHQQGGNFSGLSPECYSCHRSDYESTNDPNHITSGLPTTCEVCHSINGWEPADFNHNLTQFPLTGIHVTVNCTSCHTNGYSGTSTECYSCHQTDYNGTNDPNHITEGFPTDCSLCHTTSGWDGATFDHNLSAFPLLGKHLQVDCANCHTTVYSGTPIECLSCHQQNFNQTADPPHQSLNFSGECLICHTMNGWIPATFDHNFFALSSKHISLNCNECHSLTAYQPQCISCHLDDFLNEHKTGDNEKCWECHTTFTWNK